VLIAEVGTVQKRLHHEKNENTEAKDLHVFFLNDLFSFFFIFVFLPFDELRALRGSKSRSKGW
jgi:hypothetical protein